VKIRGVRVEPAEVEAALSTHPSVREVAVIAANATGPTTFARRLRRAGRGEAPTAGVLRDFVKRRLPSAFVPSAFVLLEALPLGPTASSTAARCPRRRPRATRARSCARAVR